MAGIIRDLTYITRCGTLFRNQRMEPMGLNARQASSLFAICREPGISQDQLSRRVVLNKSNITRQLATLEENGYVKRVPSSTDKRVMQLYPTEKALELFPQIRGVYGEWRDYLLQDMSKEEQELLERLLQQIKGKAAQWLEVHRNE